LQAAFLSPLIPSTVAPRESVALRFYSVLDGKSVTFESQARRIRMRTFRQNMTALLWGVYARVMRATSYRHDESKGTRAHLRATVDRRSDAYQV
jgi:hypothetical protein